MPTLAINKFHGLYPKLDPRNIPVGGARVADNVRFDAGDLSPFRTHKYKSVLNGDIGNLYFYREHEKTRYIAFGRDMWVTFAKNPIPDDSHNRFYWCIDPYRSDIPTGLFATANPDLSSADTTSAGSGTAYRQFVGYRVGIPAPNQKPIAKDITTLASIAYGEVTTISGSDPIQINTSNIPKFTTGQQVRIVIDPALPSNTPPPEAIGPGLPPDPDSETLDPTQPLDPTFGPEAPETVQPGRAWVLNGQTGVVIEVGPSFIRVSGIEGVQDLTETDLQAISVERALSDDDYESRSYVFTYVSEYGEEGPPSPPSNIVDVPKDGATVELIAGDWTYNLDRDGGSRSHIRYIRVYRLQAGSQNASYLQVGQLRFSGGSDPDMKWVGDPPTISTASWSGTLNESVPSGALKGVLESERWYPPPNDLKGVKVMPNGFMVGWRKNVLYFSEPHLPHAWNPDYKRTVEDDILNVESYGNTLVIGTRGRPYVATGIDPAAVTVKKVDFNAPLIRPRAMVDAGSGVAFPTTAGLMWIGESGTRLLTKDHFDQNTWERDAPERAVFFDNRIIMYTPGRKPLVIDLNEGIEVSELVGYDIGAAAAEDDDLLFVTKPQGSSAYIQLEEFRNGATPKQLRWVSGLLTTPTGCNLAWGQVYASQYPLQLTVYHANLMASGQPDLDGMDSRTYTVEGPEPFPMRGDYLSREYMLEIIGSSRIQQIIVTTEMDALKRAP